MGRQRGSHEVEYYFYYVYGWGGITIADCRLQVADLQQRGFCFYSCSATSDTLGQWYSWFAGQILGIIIIIMGIMMIMIG